MAPEFENRGFRIVDLLTESSAIEGIKFDLAWIHHAPVFYEVFLTQKIEAGTVVFCSLSHFEPLEAVPAYRDKFDLLLANSIENKTHIKETLGLDESQIVVFPNAVPSNYRGLRNKVNSPSVRQVAIISNHPPLEVLEAGALLENQGVAITHIGTGGTPTLMSPSLLLNYDAVITIGKTVPYCFALEIPVYCYDHFGGPGWLTEANFDIASRNNFSGRGFFKKTPATIADEVLAGYRDALGRLNAYMTLAEKFLSLRKNLASLFTHPRIAYSEKENTINVGQILTQHAQYIRLVKILRGREAELSGFHKELLRIKSTVSWRITKPLRFIWNKLFLRAK
ncbi:hypothetical protein PMI15_02949 [Polaromonas sp. CF318]|nr:hypothetical protein PMI15_02949 [Polaromonas sp. CF318]